MFADTTDGNRRYLTLTEPIMKVERMAEKRLN